MGFADKTISIIGDWGLGGKPDTLAVTGDESGDGSGLSDLGVQVCLRFSCVSTLASEVVTDILPRRAVNADTSTLQFANGFSLLAGGVSLK